MSFSDCVIKSEYRSLIDNVVQDFYLPILHEAVSYKRAVGFFHLLHWRKYQKVSAIWLPMVEKSKL